MRRSLFFWLEKLQITPAERKSVATLSIVLAILAGLNVGISRSAPYESEYYLELEKQFASRTNLLQEEHDKRMERYFPPQAAPVSISSVDTITVESEGNVTGESAEPRINGSVININTADFDKLQTLPGIGPAYAQRILEYRKENGVFKNLDDIKKIKGIGKKRLDKLKPFIKLRDSL